jgi:hypothetical protein
VATSPNLADKYFRFRDTELTDEQEMGCLYFGGYQVSSDSSRFTLSECLLAPV